MKLHSYIYQTGDYAVHDSEMLVPGPDLRAHLLLMLQRGAGNIPIKPNYNYMWQEEGDIGSLHIGGDEGAILTARVVPYQSYVPEAIRRLDGIMQELVDTDTAAYAKGLPETIATPCILILPMPALHRLLRDDVRAILSIAYGLSVVWLEGKGL
jgi:hypothetical protein